MYNNTCDYDYLINQCSQVQCIIEESVNSMNETHPLSAAYLSVARATTLIRHADNTDRLVEIRNQIDDARSGLEEYARYSGVDISYCDPATFMGVINTTPILRNIVDVLDVEIAYRADNYIYSESSSAKHPVFTYKNSITILDK